MPRRTDTPKAADEPGTPGRDAATRTSATPGGDAAARAGATPEAATPGPGSVPDIERVFREEYGRAVAVLVRVLGDIDVAEEAVQDAFTAAVQRWPSSGLPPSPAGWIITTARNRAIDRLRRESSRQDRHAQAALLHAAGEPAWEGPVRDDRLRLIFTCCHPALATAAQVALTLRLLGGLTTAEIARAFLVPEATMAQRLVRAKTKIREGQALVRACLRRNQPGPYQLQAAINAVHSDAPDAGSTSWPQILRLYDQLMAQVPSPVVALHRAVAVAEVDGPGAALRLVDNLDLGRYHLFHAIRADLMRRLGRRDQAERSYRAAIAAAQNTAERSNRTTR